MTPSEFFDLAQYAYTRVSPLMMSLNGRLSIQLNFENAYPGVDVWVHDKPGGVIDYRNAMTSTEQVDAFVASLRAKSTAIIIPKVSAASVSLQEHSIAA